MTTTPPITGPRPDGWYWVKWGGTLQRDPYESVAGQWFIEGEEIPELEQGDFEVVCRIPTPEEITDYTREASK